MTPTVILQINSASGPSWITRDDRGEIIETVDEYPDGTPNWENGGICDARGGGGQEGFQLLHESLMAAEKNAALLGITIKPLERTP